ncbi:MAG: riboflavin synthase, partial [Lautropia mirabilis]
MFTGIVAAIGSIRQVSPLGEDGVRLDVAAGELDMSDVAIGDSIAIQGACMTVVEKTADSFAVDVSAESLRRTTGLAGTGPVNLEKAMRLSDRVGGHLVSGHVDGLGVVRRFEPVGESHLLEILAPQALAGFLVYKGSITVDGVSLTVNHVEDLPLAKAADPAWPEAARAVLAGRGPSVASAG